MSKQSFKLLAVRSLACLVLMFAALAPAAAVAQTTYTWTGGGSNDNWGTGSNWSGGTAPSGDSGNTVLVFSGSTRTSPTNDLSNWYPGVGRLEFASGAASFTLGGNPFGFRPYLGSQLQQIFQNSANTQTIGVNEFSFRAESNSQINLNAGDLVISSSNMYIDMNADTWRQLFVTGNDSTRRTLTFSGNVNRGNTGSGNKDPDIVIQNNKRVLVTGSLSNGTGNDGSIFIDSGVLEFGSTGVMTGGRPVVGATSGSGTAAVYLNSAGSTFGQQLEIRAGSSGPRIVGGLNTSGTVTFSGDFVATGSPSDYDLKAATGGTVVVSGQRNVAGTLQVNRVDGATAFGGTVEISSTATGGSTATVVNAGTLRVRDVVDNGWGTLRGSVTVNAGAQLDLAGSSAALGWQSGGRVTSLSLAAGSVLNSNRQHIWLAGGTVSLTAATMQTNGGVTSATADYFEWGDSPVATVASSGTSVIAGRINLRGDALSGRILNFTVADGAAATDLLVSAAITESAGSSGTAGIAKYGAGTMKLTGSNSFTNQSLIYAGTLEVDSLAQLGTSSVEFNAASGDSGTLRYSGATGSSSQNLWIDNSGITRAAIDVSQAGTTLTWTPAGGTVNKNLTKVGAGTLSYGGAITGTATVGVEAGMLVLTGSNSYTGPTTVSAGRLQVNSSNAITSGTITLGDATTGASDTSLFIDATSAAATVSRPIVIANQGSGTATLGSASTGGSNNAVFGGAVSLGKDVFLNGGTTGDRLGFTGGISGTGNVTVNGSNRVLFSGAANTYTGTTAILTGATLQLGDGIATTTSFIPDSGDVNVAGTLSLAKNGNSEAINALTGSGTVQAFFSNNTLAVGGAGGSGTFSGVLGQNGGTLSVVKSGTGTQVLNGSSTYTGSTSLAGGMLGAGSAAALGSGGTISFDGGTLQYSGSNTTDYSGRFSNAAGQAYSIDTNGNTVTLASALTSSGGSLTKLGAGTLVLTGNNTLSGAATITQGTLQVGNGAAASNLPGARSIAAGARLLVSNTAYSLAAGWSTITGAGTLELDGGSTYGNWGTVALPSGFTGTLQVDNAGRFDVSGTSALGNASAVTIQSGAQMLVTGVNQTFTQAFSIAGFGSETNWNYGALRTYGNGTVFSGSVTLTGNAGLMTQNHIGNSSMTISGNIGDGGAGYGLTIRSANLSGNISPITLSGSNSYSGDTIVTSGSLNIGGRFALAGSTFDTAGSGSFALTAAGTNTYVLGGLKGSKAFAMGANSLEVGGNGQSTTYAGALSGSGGLTKVGGGNLTLSGTSSHAGPTTVAAGRLSVNGSLGNTAVTVQNGAALGGSGAIAGSLAVLAGGTVSPGNSIESLAVGVTTFSGSSTFAYEVNSSLLGSLGTAADLLVVNGDLSIGSGSILSIADLNPSPAPFVNYTTIFALINYSGTWNGGLFTYNGSPLADDSTFFAGSQEWHIDYNRASATSLDNFTGDYLAGGRFVAITAVPEPSTWALALVGLVGGWAMCRRRPSRGDCP